MICAEDRARAAERRATAIRVVRLMNVDLQAQSQPTGPSLVRWAFCVLLICVLSACAQTQHVRPANVRADAALGRGADILIVEPDVEISELLASGLQEVRADWTEAARTHVSAALDGLLADRGASTRHFNYADANDIAQAQRQIVLLHEAVGQSVLMHRYIGVVLPSKGDAFDWTLGSGARQLDPTARYALFVYLRDSHASAGRKAMLALSLIGVGVSLGQQIGFASLVDLNDGRLVWFNLLLSPTGDLRTADAARKAVDLLLDGAPL